MISINQIIDKLETTLNKNIAESLNGVFPNRHFLFNIYLDTGDYKPPIFEQNIETYYINTLATINTSTAEGIVSDAYNASVSMRLEFLIPFADCQDESGKAVFVENVRDYLATILQNAQEDELTDGDNVSYYVGMQYRIASTGMREMRPRVGDSLTLLVFADFFISSGGISSSDIILELGTGFGEDGNFVRIYPTQHGLRRDATSETNVSTDSGSGGATMQGSVLTVTFAMPLRKNAASFAALDWILRGRKTVLTLAITVPTAQGQTTTSIPVIYDSVGVSCAQLYNANLVATIRQELSPSDDGGDE